MLFNVVVALFPEPYTTSELLPSTTLTKLIETCCLTQFSSASFCVLSDAVPTTVAVLIVEAEYVFKYAGRNSRLDEIHAAVLDVKLKYLDEDNAHRKAMAKLYYEGIKNPLITLPDRLADDQNVYHLFPVFCERRDELQAYLKDNGVGTVIHYPIPPFKQECYAGESWNKPQLVLPITEQIHDTELSLPIGPVISENDILKVIDLLNSFK